MEHREASLEEWKRLFETAIAFKQLECWEWIGNEDYFVVSDPETGELGYCVVLGNGGMEFGLNVYMGKESAGYLQKLLNDDIQDNDEFLRQTKAIVVNFEDRGDLEKTDLDLIRRLGYKFRGSKEWPLFRSYEPGLVPWTLHQGQVRFLTTALEQTIMYAQRLYLERMGKVPVAEEAYGKRLHRVPTIHEDGVSWKDQWRPFVEDIVEEEPYQYSDELMLKQIQKQMPSGNDVWESDYDFAPIIIGEKGQRGYYPRLCLWVNGKDGMILDAAIIEAVDCRAEYVNQLLKLIRNKNRKPALIRVGSHKAYAALEHAADKLGIKLKLDRRLDALDEAREAIIGGIG
ncbi:hypothetical protein [Cohnella sp.]|uniref:DUF7309 domain-containing protein n=1 Tax=Cohnella sp. TaxID=1883426 RepID=UPI00356219CD